MNDVVGVAVEARQHRRLGRALDERVRRLERAQVARARARRRGRTRRPPREAREVELRAAAVEVVERDELPVGVALGEGDGEVGADEAGAAGDEDPHGGRSVASVMPSRRSQIALSADEQRELLESERVVVRRLDRAARLAARDAALVRAARRRDLGLDLREVAEGPEPRARPAGDAPDRDRPRVRRASRRPDRGRGRAPHRP